MNSGQANELLFGTGGVPLSAKSRSTEAGIERIAELGLGCMEVEFVQGVKMSPQVAATVGELAERKKVALTAHGPYFVNLNAVEPQKVHMSKERVFSVGTWRRENVNQAVIEQGTNLAFCSSDRRG